MIVIDRLTANHWKEFSERAHAVCFDEHKPASWDRIDFALVARRGTELLGYMTCRESSEISLYWQYGGSFPGTRGTTLSWKIYQELSDYCMLHYATISTMIENTNTVMLKMALKIGFRVIGCRTIQGKILLELARGAHVA